jgi:hypothetical protein
MECIRLRRPLISLSQSLEPWCEGSGAMTGGKSGRADKGVDRQFRTRNVASRATLWRGCGQRPRHWPQR